MKVPISWLKEYVPVELPVGEIAHRLTMAGTEVGAVERMGGDWSSIVVGLVKSVRPHPNADRLTLVTVETGSDHVGLVEVVCGAPNVAEGQKIAYAAVGASLIDPHTGKTEKLKRARIRGVASNGMVCSERELGLGDDHEGILVLDVGAPVGLPLAGYLGDDVLDLEVTPNRPDCLSILGVGREVAALTGRCVTEPALDYPEEGPDAAALASVRIDDPDLCARYTATVLQGVKLGPSPDWLVERLAAVGQSSINNVVDITNYVMFELGQPLHAFDLDGVQDRTIVVRRAREAERLVTLDGVDRALTTDMLVIADSEKPIGLAGVMGGANTEIGEATINVLLESATFDGPNNRRTAAALSMRTEATLRFEKGLRPPLSEVALRRATRMIREIAGGTIARGILDAWPGRERYKPVVFASREKLRRILGVDFDDTRVTATLESLGFSVEVDRSGYAVDVPYWRPDVTAAEDVAEELARIIGYDTIPISVIAAPIPKWEPAPERDLRERVRDALAASGLQETISYPLTTSEALVRIQPRAELPEPLRVVNPLASEHIVLRTALRASVLQTLVRNTRTWRGPVAIFEVARVYLDCGEGLPEERETAAGVLAGVRSEPSWKSERGEFDYYDAKSVVEEVLVALGVVGEFEPVHDATFAAGRCASISVDGARVGVVGELATEVLEAFDCDISPVAMFEIDLPALREAAGADAATPTAYRSFHRFPESIHDLAIVVDEPVPAAGILKIIERNRLVRRVDVFDVYHGAGVPEGRKSLTLRVVYQSGNRTLTAEEVTKAEGSILRALKREVGAVLRT